MEPEQFDFEKLEQDVGSWAAENFPGQPPSYPLIGAGEEAGECTRSVLKRLQGIDDSTKYDQRDDVGPDAEKDAVGDVVIYLCDYFYRKDHVSLGDVSIRQEREYDRADEAVLDMYRYFGRLCGGEMDDDGGYIVSNTGRFLGALVGFCELRGYSFTECIIDAWTEVSGREWDSNVQV